MQNGNIHNSSPCVDCFEHFNTLLHTVKYLVYTKRDEKHHGGYSMEKIHFRNYSPTLISSGREYLERITK